MNPWLGIILIVALLVAAMFGVRWAGHRFMWHAELSRKAVHVLMGLSCLTFPWLFQEAWPVWIIAGLSVVSLSAVRLVPALRVRLGGVLSGVERQSWGELFYAPSVAFVFWLSHGDPLRFGVPVLVLALADAAAALIGRRYGCARFETDDGIKSFEGSTGFFFTAFFATHIPLLLWTSVGRLECLLIGVVMGLLTMLIEAIAWRGLDNVFVPLATYICLVRLLPLAASGLYQRITVLVLILAFFWFWRRFTRFTNAAMIGAALVIYVSWSVGSYKWLIAPLSALAGYTLLCRGSVSNPKRHTVHTIAWIGGVGMCWICLAEVIRNFDVVYAYGVAYAAHLGMSSLAYFSDARHNIQIRNATVRAAMVGFVFPAMPYLLVWRHNPNLWKLALLGAVLIFAAVAAFARIQPALRSCPSDNARWFRQGTIAIVVSVTAFILISWIEPCPTSFE